MVSFVEEKDPFESLKQNYLKGEPIEDLPAFEDK